MEYRAGRSYCFLIGAFIFHKIKMKIKTVLLNLFLKVETASGIIFKLIILKMENVRLVLHRLR